MPRHRLRVIAGGHCDHAALALRIGQERQPVGRSTLLERTGDLQVVELQHHIGAGGARHRLTRKCRRAQYTAGDPLGGRRHIGEAQHLR
jgi:hypothetical protein